jgi:hypothetical protein
MTLPNSGSISLNQMHVEVGGSSGSNVSINDADIRNLIGKGSGSTMAFNEWYGASFGTPSFTWTATPGEYVIITAEYVWLYNSDYWNQSLAFHSGGSGVHQSGTATEFTDSAGTLQTVVHVTSFFGFKGPAGFRITLLNHNAGTNWTFNLLNSGLIITPGQAFTYNGVTWTGGTPQNRTTYNAAGTSFNSTTYDWSTFMTMNLNFTGQITNTFT